MKVPPGITEIWVECKEGTGYLSRLEGQRLIIHTFSKRMKRLNRQPKDANENVRSSAIT